MLTAAFFPNALDGFCPACGFLVLECVCELRKAHAPGCRHLKAAECPVELPCPHDLHVCPVCDACDCGANAHGAR